MRAYERVFADIHSSFAASVWIFTDSCERLLSPLNLPHNQLNQLLGERSLDAWKDAELCKGLQSRLGSNCGIYLSLVFKLNRGITKFGKKLGLRENLTVRPC